MTAAPAELDVHTFVAGWAGARLAESLALLLELSDRWVGAVVLEAVGVLVAVQMKPPEDAHPDALHAARIFGAAEALRETLGAPLFPSYRDHYQRGITAARAQLDDQTFVAAWAEGQAMTLEQMIEYALHLASPENPASTDRSSVSRTAAPAPALSLSHPSEAALAEQCQAFLQEHACLFSVPLSPSHRP